MFEIFKKLTNKPSSYELLRVKKSKYRQFFNTPLGKEILIDLMKESKMYSNTYTEDLKIVEGRRSLVYYILDKLYKNIEQGVIDDYRE